MKIVLIDGNSLLYRAFFALPPTLTLASGQTVNAVYGFAAMLIRLLTDEEPDVAAVAFDTKAPTFRHKAYAQYKAHRQPTPPELITQFPLIKEFLTALAVPTIEMDGYEADDILATLARRADSEGHEVMVVTGDRDSFQLIDDNVKVMTTRKGISDIVIYDKEAVMERYGLVPAQIPDFLGLKGDSSDNIPGVPGIGEKTAAKLVAEFGGVEKIYESIDDVRPERIKQLLIDNRDQAEMGYKLALLDFEVPVDVKLDEARWGGWQADEVRRAFDRLEFRTLRDRFFAKFEPGGESIETVTVDIRAVDAAGFAAHLGSLQGQDVGLALEPGDNGDICLAACTGSAQAVVCAPAGRGELTESLRGSLKAAVRANRVAAFDSKRLLRHIEAGGTADPTAIFDPELAAYLLDSLSSSYEPGELAERYLGVSYAAGDDQAAQAGIRACLAVALRPGLEEGLAAGNMRSLFEEIETPLVGVLARMESLGVGLDSSYLRGLSAQMAGELEGLVEGIYAAAGEEFNINSPQQLAKILFEKMGLSPGRKTKSKSAYATDAKVLAALAGEHPIAGMLVRYRELAKLKSTYIDALPKLVDAHTKRLHTSFNQTVTATGRLSSSNPNLQNIPTRTELGKQIRKAFIPTHAGERLLAADYSQIELRLLAHFSGDEKLASLFTVEADIHAATAAEVFGVPLPEVTPELRTRAKAVNFGIIYGISGFGLGEQLEIDAGEAADYIKTYLDRYPGVKEYIDRSVAQARETGFVTTIAGRRRYLPELKSPAHQVRAFGERVAMNAPLQGSASDIIKKAMIDMEKRLLSEGLQSRMVLQVHDELILEVTPMEEQTVVDLVREEMEGAWQLTVPLKVDISLGDNWGEL